MTIRNTLRWLAAYLAALLTGSWSGGLILWLGDMRLDRLADVIVSGPVVALVVGVLVLPAALAASWLVRRSRDWRRFAALGAAVGVIGALSVGMMFSGDPLNLSLLLDREALNLTSLALPSGALAGVVFHQVWTRTEARS